MSYEGEKTAEKRNGYSTKKVTYLYLPLAGAQGTPLHWQQWYIFSCQDILSELV